MRDHSRHIQADRDEARQIIVGHCPVITETESVPVKDAVGRVLAQDALSQWDSPNVLTCALDSIAVHWSDFADGMPDTSGWVRGRDWTFANTGTAMPAGFDSAIVVEQAEFSDDDAKVILKAGPEGRFDGTVAPGSWMKKGEVLVPKGRVLTPLLAARIATGNNPRVCVLRRPRVIYIPTGNELICAADAPVPPGKNVESTSVMISEKVRSWGGDPLVYGIVPDDRASLRQAIAEAAGQADIVVLNAGSSKGSEDWSMEVLEEIGTVYYHQTNHGPGHHSSFSVVKGTPVVGLSGPPGGAAIAADHYLYPAVKARLGQDPRLKKVKARLAGSFESSRSKTGKRKKRRFISGANYVVKQMKLALSEDGVLEAWPPESSHLSPLQAEDADAYYLLCTAEGAADPQPGDLIEVELRPR